MSAALQVELTLPATCRRWWPAASGHPLGSVPVRGDCSTARPPWRARPWLGITRQAPCWAMAPCCAFWDRCPPLSWWAARASH